MKNPVGCQISGATELRIAIDFSHEPWKTLALVVLRHFEQQLEEVGYRINEFEAMVDIVCQQEGGLQ